MYKQPELKKIEYAIGETLATSGENIYAYDNETTLNIPTDK